MRAAELDAFERGTCADFALNTVGFEKYCP